MPVSCRSAIAPAATPPTRVTSAAPSSSPTATSPPCAMASRTIATPWECASTSISCPRSSWSSPRPISPIGSSAATTKRSCNTPFASDRRYRRREMLTASAKLLVAALLTAGCALARAADLYVICNAHVALSPADVRDLFLGEKQFAYVGGAQGHVRVADHV